MSTKDVELPLLSHNAALHTPSQKPKHQRSHFMNHLSSTPSPLKYISKLPFLQWATFLDTLPHVKRLNACHTSANIKDLPLPDKSFNIEAKLISLDSDWSKQLETTSPSFSKALYTTFIKQIIACLTFNFIDCTARLWASLFMGKIINMITSSNLGEEIEPEELMQSAVILSILVLISYGAVNWEFFLSFTNGGKARLAITSLLYKKLHSVSLTSLHEFKIGKVINLMANDLNDIEIGVTYMPTMCMTVYMILLGTFIMWGYFGASCLLGLLASGVFIILQIYLTAKTEEPASENKHLTDDRVKFTNEIIENIRLIKMYAWEEPFKKNIEALRKKEYDTFMKISYIDAIGRNLSIISTYLSMLLICVAYVYIGGILSPEKIYVSMVILGFISGGLLYFHIGRSALVNFKLIFGRVQQILQIEDILTVEETTKKLSVQNRGKNSVHSKGTIFFENFTGYWDKAGQTPCLSNINVTIKPGTLTTVIGKIGSGKSTLLYSLLKELPVTEGTLSFTGKVAYVEQEPIIFSGTVRDNILFGKEYHDDMYNQVIKVCCLETDLAILANGDKTLIGERGVNLSGGQKARISFARAIYSESDILLLDDPFSAVDSKVAKGMFDKGLKEVLRTGKTVILVTHHIHFARESDYVLVMNGGRIEAKGTFQEIEKMDVDLLNIFKGIESRKASMNSDSGEPNEKEDKKDIQEYTDEELVAEDTTSVSWDTYKVYLQVSGTYKDLIIMSFLFIVLQVLMIYYIKFIGYWALQHTNFYYNNPDQSPDEFDHSYYIIVSCVLLVLIYILSYFKRVKFTEFLLSTNSALHTKMINSLITAPVLFFDVNPVGRILNRFSNDIGLLDKRNIASAFDLFDGLLYSFSLLLTICFVNPISFILGIIVIYSLYRTKVFFTNTSLLSKKLEVTSRSPIFSTVSATLSGLLIIRVYNQGNRFIQDFMDLIYNNVKAFAFMGKSIRLFAVIMDAAIRTLMILGILMFASLTFYYHFDSALVGLSLMFLLQIGEETSYTIRQTLNVDINMQSAQRMLEYCDLESEAPQQVPRKDSLVQMQFKGNWPVRGDIVFNDVYLKYRPELNYAVNGLSFSITGGTKVACVGRTGAGKSSIIQALFRMVEIDNTTEHYDSYIKIDGVDIKTLGLNLLRRSLSIIPQTPVVFTGTIRRNLDPFGKRSDREIWQVLEEVSLKERVMALENRLDTDMTMSASVFSTGQKQLICLARAILMKSKVLILDEATANVDIETDEFIQRKILEKFSDCTVLTIAHRLITIANYDKVIVIDQGRMVEYDSPYSLLVENINDDRITRRDGIFVDMVKNTGKSMSKKIFKIAKEHYFEKEKK